MLALLLVLAAAPADVQWLGPKPVLPVKRVVTLAPSLTETVLALGAVNALVGVSRFDEFPEVQKLPKTGGLNDISVETVVSLKPDLVVVQKAPGNQKTVETLARLGVSVLALPLTSISDVSVAMTELGRVLGRADAAKAMVTELAQARALAHQGRSRTPKKVMLIYGFSPLVVAGPGSFADELLEDCGAVNVAGKAPTAYPMYSLERAVALAPDVVIDAAEVKDGKDALLALEPMKKAKWVELPTKDLLHPGPALARALPSLCALLSSTQK